MTTPTDKELSDFLAVEVMGWRESPSCCWWDKREQRIAKSLWNPAENIDQALECLETVKFFTTNKQQPARAICLAIVEAHKG